MKQTEYIAILAGNIQQFKEYINYKYDIENINSNVGVSNSGNEKYIYIFNENSIRGYRFNRYEIIGTFYERRDSSEIEEAVKINTNN